MAPAAVISLSAGRRAGPALRLLGDRQLGRLASKGDPRAFAAIYERHHQDLYRYCRSITGNAEDASDALQNTMAAALRSLPGDRREIALRPWLFKVAHNESISLMRRKRASAELNENSASSAPGPYGIACLHERVSGLMANLRELPERQRGALIMRELNGLDYDEIATTLGISGAAARQTVYEARLALTELEEGRELACEAVRRSISARDGRVLRGRRMRAHLRDCGRCADFREQLDLRRAALPVLFPALPAAAAAAVFGASVKGAGGAGVGAGASLGLAAGAGSGGATSLVAGALSQAGASAVAKSAAAVAMALAAGVGTMEVATKEDHGASRRAESQLSARAPSALRTAGVGRVHHRRVGAAARRPPSRGTRSAPARVSPSRVHSSARAGAKPVGARRPAAAPPIEPAPAPEPVTVHQPAAPPEAPTTPVSRPTAPTVPQPWQQQYEEGMRYYQQSMESSQQVIQQTMQRVQQVMNNLFSGTGQR